jgi:hypothetical protein
VIGIEKENAIGNELENTGPVDGCYFPFLAGSFLAFIDSRKR